MKKSIFENIKNGSIKQIINMYPLGLEKPEYVANVYAFLLPDTAG
jgi:hypothetical protein